MPMTSPSRFTSGPPLLPGLMAASVWRKSSRVGDAHAAALGADDAGRDRAFQSKGLAEGQHPIADLDLVAVAQPGGRQRPRPLIRSTAKSVFGSVLMSTALNSRPSCKRTMILAAAGDNVIVRQDDARRIDDHARAGLIAPCRGISGIEGNCLKNWRSCGLFLNMSPNGVPLNPKAFPPYCRSGTTFRPGCLGVSGVLVMVTTEGRTLFPPRHGRPATASSRKSGPSVAAVRRTRADGSPSRRWVLPAGPRRTSASSARRLARVGHRQSGSGPQGDCGKHRQHGCRDERGPMPPRSDFVFIKFSPFFPFKCNVKIERKVVSSSECCGAAPRANALALAARHAAPSHTPY